MTIKNRETMERAIGIIEGVSYGVNENVQTALICVCEMLDAILINEEKNDEELLQ